MATLTETAYLTKRFLKLFAIFVVAFFVVSGIWGSVKSIWTKSHPPAPAAPTVAFGKLPKIIFKEGADDLPKLTFKLETVDGNLPKLTNIEKVYFIPLPSSNLLDFERANQKAKKMGFTREPQAVSEILYRWSTEATPSTTLEININLNNFRLGYDFATDTELLINKNLPSNQQAAQEAKTFLANNDFLPEDLGSGTATFDYLKFMPPKLEWAPSISEADFVRVNLFRANIDEKPLLPPNPKNSLVSFLFSGSRSTSRRIVEVNYRYLPIDKEISSTYPLRPVEDAWEDLKAQKGYIANLGNNQEDKITIRKIYLAYFEPEIPQHYLQPIYVFEGDAEFYGYVPAVDTNWIE